MMLNTIEWWWVGWVSVILFKFLKSCLNPKKVGGGGNAPKTAKIGTRVENMGFYVYPLFYVENRGIIEWCLSKLYGFKSLPNSTTDEPWRNWWPKILIGAASRLTIIDCWWFWVFWEFHSKPQHWSALFKFLYSKSNEKQSPTSGNRNINNKYWNLTENIAISTLSK